LFRRLQSLSIAFRAIGADLSAAKNPWATIGRGSRITITYRQLAVDGGLMAYGLETFAAFHQTADYVDRVLCGEKPSALPAPGADQNINSSSTCKQRDG
jgi:hypothetical protein